jgi:hypothetical protein
MTGFAAAASVVTSVAGFAGADAPKTARWTHRDSGAFRYPAGVSRRTPVCFSVRRSGQPSRPSAIACFFSLKH